ncbi:UDP-N-acetylmuramoyl-L-alanine--D-glutamate ligase, partial [Patescibacteria group bacterium]|nr:UDP-N-acetylmuramoyl-L-alanine--D-glutamate ligase [Patescibacteria group bacterium]
ILNKVTGLFLKDEKIIVNSGTFLFQLVIFSVKNCFTGMEKLMGIPGTVGGAIYGNAGAYSKSTSDFLIRVKVTDGDKPYWISKKDLEFSYRDSNFKKDKRLILEAEFKLKKEEKGIVESNLNKILKDRQRKYKEGIYCPGSFFKNIEVKDLSKSILSKIPKEKIVYGKIPAGYLLESVSSKGLKIGNIEVSKEHANFFINKGGGTAKDFYDLAMLLRKKVFDKYGISLEPEVQVIGFEKNIKNIAIIGFGLEGKDLVKYFINKGYDITVFDNKEEKELEISKDFKNVHFVTGKNYLSGNLNVFETIYRSPGVYRYKRKLVEAEKNGITISSATQLFFDECPGKIIAVTGTKGKGTTSTLIYNILKKYGKDVFLVGNIGKPFLEILPKLNSKSWVVMELSSFQLIDLKKSPHIAIVLNITEDHLDWHKNREEYIDSKKNILIYQSKKDFAVINSDYKISESFKNITKAKVYLTSVKKEVNGCYVKGKNIVLNIDKKKSAVGNVEKLILRGKHNWENINSAILAAFLAGAKLQSIKEETFSFKGLEHRLEFVRTFKGVSFYNDSFATGPQPTIAAINSFNEPLTLILGGYDKGLNYIGLIDEINEYKNKLKVILIGDLQEKIYELLSKSFPKKKIFKLDKSNMQEIIKKAVKITASKGIILLSPAAASFDMFKNYKERGMLFKKAVLELK